MATAKIPAEAEKTVEVSVEEVTIRFLCGATAETMTGGHLHLQADKLPVQLKDWIEGKVKAHLERTG